MSGTKQIQIYKRESALLTYTAETRTDVADIRRHSKSGKFPNIRRKKRDKMNVILTNIFRDMNVQIEISAGSKAQLNINNID